MRFLLEQTRRLAPLVSGWASAAGCALARASSSLLHTVRSLHWAGRLHRARALPASGLRIVLALCLAGTPVLADVLPDDRADVLYHDYDGGGITVQGPSVLIRKKVGDSLSFTASYYEDMISSASIDVKLSASPYKETRQQWGTSVDYQHGKTTYTVGFIHSEEPDYKADTAYYSLSQSMFGDLTTVTMGFRRGWDIVLRDIKDPDGQIVNDPSFHQTADHRAYTAGLSQVLTRNLLLGINYEKITDQGYLANPYRKILYVDPTAAAGFSQAPQVYPGTRTSDAISGQLKYFLPYRAALTASYRYYQDTWGIEGHTGELDYTQPLGHWILDGSVRYYTQTHADFYSNIFPSIDYSNFEARDRELAAFYSVTVGGGLSYEFHVPGAPWISKSSLNLHYDRLMIYYSDFTNALPVVFDGIAPGALYRLDANVFQAFASVWF
jgi:hypothetical protein